MGLDMYVWSVEQNGVKGDFDYVDAGRFKIHEWRALTETLPCVDKGCEKQRLKKV